MLRITDGKGSSPELRSLYILSLDLGLKAFICKERFKRSRCRKGDLIPIVRVERLKQKQIQNALKGKNPGRQADNAHRKGTDSKEQSGGEHHDEIGTAGTVNTGETSYQTPSRIEDPDLPDLNPDDNLNYYYIRNTNST